MAVTHCGPVNDDFEIDRGWTIDAGHTDTATSGAFERGDPPEDQELGRRKAGEAGMQRSVRAGDRSTGRVRRSTPMTSTAAPPLRNRPHSSSVPPAPVAGRSTSITRSPTTRSPARPTTCVFSPTARRCSASQAARPIKTPCGRTRTLSLDAFAGQTVRLTVEASDGASDSLVEAAVDDVRVYQQP